MIGIYPKNKKFNIYFQDYNLEDKIFITEVTSDNLGKITFDETKLKGKKGWILVNMLESPYTPNFSLPYSDESNINLKKICKEGDFITLTSEIDVYYGILENKIISKKLEKGTYKINNDLFSDVIPGVTKYGYIKESDLNTIKFIKNYKIICQS